MNWRIIQGDALERLRELPERSVQTCITSPPYYGLRDYGTAEWAGGDEACSHIKTTQHREQPERPKGWDGAFRHTSQPLPVAYSDLCGKCGARRIDSQLGLEPTPDEYVQKLVAVFREVRRVLRDDGTVWLNLGDSYASVGGERTYGSHDGLTGRAEQPGSRISVAGAKPKDLLGIPWAVAFALRADGWYLRSDIIWSKPNPMPESVTDRPTKAHEYLFLLSKQPRYFYDVDAIREEPQNDFGSTWERRKENGHPTRYGHDAASQAEIPLGSHPAGRNKRSVWHVATQPFPDAHFAVFPPKLIEPCVLAGSAQGDAVLDPFAGAGTTGVVALRHGRSFIGIELNESYCEMARTRIRDDAPLFNWANEAA